MSGLIKVTLFSIYFITMGLLAFAQVSEKPDKNTLLWRVSGNGLTKPSYVFGTIHIICKEDGEKVLTPVIKEAIRSSNEVIFEIDITNTAQRIVATLRNSKMANDTTLDQLVRKKELKIITDYFSTNKTQIPLNQISTSRPLVLASTVYSNFLQCPNKTDMERMLADVADSYKIKISGISSIKEQAGFTDSISYKAQAKELLDAINKVKHPELNSQYFNINKFYKNQQLIALDSMLNRTSMRKPTKEGNVFIKTRNELWVPRIVDKMKAGQVFLAVGVAHLFGEYGLVTSLRKQGYTVEGVLNNN